MGCRWYASCFTGHESGWVLRRVTLHQPEGWGKMSKWRDTDYSSIVIGGAEDQDVVMTSVEAAEYLKMHVKTVCRLAKERKIPAKKVGSEWRLSLIHISEPTRL